MSPFSGRRPEDPLIGRLVDEKYVVRALLGEGAFGRVYKAQHTETDTYVVLKFLRHEHETEEGIARFDAEARVPARIRTGVVKCLDYRRIDGRLCLVQEFIDGENLRDYLQRMRTLDAQVALRIAVQVAETLDIAHNRCHIVHRDLTPKNIMLADVEPRPSEVRVKVIDWGIAKEFDRDHVHEEQTATGPAVDYEPPEGRQVVHDRADVYTFGVVLYEMLAGERPSPASNPDIHSRYSALDVPQLAAVPPRVLDVLARCLATHSRYRPGINWVYSELRKAFEDELNQAQRDLERALEEAESDKRTLGGQLDELRRLYQGQLQSNQNLNARMVTVERSCEEALRNFANQANEMASLQRDASEQRQKFSSELERVRHAFEQEQKRGVALGMQSRTLEQELAQARQNLHQVNQELESARKEQASCDRVSNERLQQLRLFEGRLRTTESALHQCQAAAREHEEELRRIQEEQARFGTKREYELRTRTDELEAQTRSHSQELAALQAALTERDEKLAMLVRERRSLQRARRNSIAAGAALFVVGTIGGVVAWRQGPARGGEAALVPATAPHQERPLVAAPPPAVSEVAHPTPPKPQPDPPLLPLTPPAERSTRVTPSRLQWVEGVVAGAVRSQLNLMDVWGDGSGRLYAVGGYRTRTGEGGDEAALNQAAVLFSQDDGAHWRRLELPRKPHSSHLFGVLGFHAGPVFVVGAGVLFKVTDDLFTGQTVQSRSGAGREVLRSLWGTTQDELYIPSASPGGHLFHYRNGGELEGRIEQEKLPTGDSLYRAWGDQRSIWVVGTGGTMLRHDRRRGTWHRINLLTAGQHPPEVGANEETLYDVVGGDDAVVACGEVRPRDGAVTGIYYRTINNGRSWERQPLPNPCYALRRLNDGRFLLAGVGARLRLLSPSGELSELTIPIPRTSYNIKRVIGTALDRLLAVGWEGLIVYSKASTGDHDGNRGL